MPNSDYPKLFSKLTPQCHELVNDLAIKIDNCTSLNEAEKELIFELLENYTKLKGKRGPKKTQTTRDGKLAHDYEQLSKQGYKGQELLKIVCDRYKLKIPISGENNAFYKALSRGRASNAIFDKFNRIKATRKNNT